jgi:hypothetical protein
MSTSEDVKTNAWLMRGIGNLAGELALKDSRLSFTTLAGYGQLLSYQLRCLEQETNQAGLEGKVNRGESTTVFDVALSGITATVFPWYYLSGGVQLTMGGITYKFLFAAPSNSKIRTERDLSEAFGMLGEHLEGRRALKAWKAALSAR